MKRVALSLALLLVGGLLGAAAVSLVSFKPRFPSHLGLSPSEATAVSLATTSAAPVAVEPVPPPVPVAPVSQPPSSFQPPSSEIASVPEPAPLPVVKTPEAPPVQAKPAIVRGERDVRGGKEVRDLSRDRCGGRTIRSITVLPDDSVHVDC